MAGSVKDGNTDVEFSTSLSQIRAAAASAASKQITDAGLSFNESYSGYTPYALSQRLDLWVEGQVSSYDDATGGIERDGHFGILYVGMDYALAPGVLIGGLVQFDRTRETVEDPDITGSVEGTGWMAGPYLGVKLRDDLFFDARGAWGKSSNDIDLTDDIAGHRTGSFDTDRWLATASLTGNYLYGNMRVSPQVSVEYGNEVSDDYFMSNLQKVNSVDVTIGRLTFGPEFGYKHYYENGTSIEPHMSVKGIWTFEGDELELSTGTVDLDQFRASIEGGVIVRAADGYAFRAAGSYDGIGDEDLEAWSAKLWLNIPVN
jgi:outer membrane autotransporter protein